MDVAISVIVPFYNCVLDLRRCLEHLEKQTFEDYEVVLIDDGSFDGSSEVAKVFCDKNHNFRYFNKPNGGVSSARNMGIEKASGEYLMFCDSDDFYEAEALKTMYTAIERNHSDLAICGVRKLIGGYSTYVSFNDEVFDTTESIRTLFLRMYKEYSLNWMVAKLFKRSTILKQRIFLHEDVAIGEDLDWICRYAYFVQSVTTVSGHIYTYEIKHPGSLSQRFHANYFAAIDDAYYSLRRLLEKFESSGEEIRILNERHLKEYWKGLMDVNKPTCRLTRKEKIDYVSSYKKNTFFIEYIKIASTRDWKLKLLNIRSEMIQLFIVTVLGTISKFKRMGMYERKNQG